MLKLRWLLTLVLGCFARTIFSDESSASEYVVQLTKSNFDDFIQKHEFSLVKFYAPWCGHCKKLAPEYEAAAKILKEENIPLAEVNVVDEEELQARYDIKGYPTLKIFRHGEPSEYGGGRTTDTIVQYVRRMTGPALEKSASFDAAKTQAQAVSVGYIGYFTSNTSDAYNYYKNAANNMRIAGKFFVVVDSKGNDSIVAFRTDEGMSEPVKAASQEAVNDYISEEKFPLFGGIDTSNYADYFASQKSMMWFIGTKDNFTNAAAVVREAAKDFRKDFHFVWLDYSAFKEHAANALGVSEIPALVAQVQEARYMYTDADFQSSKPIKKFAEAAVEGKLPRHYLTEPIPEVNDEPVKTVVGQNLVKEVLQSDKDVYLEVYAPWCGHCKLFQPIYTQFAEAVADYDHIAVYKMDGTKNESPDPILHWEGFPTIYLIPAKTHEPIVFDGQRTIEGLVQFYNKHAEKPIQLPDAETKSSTEPPSEPELKDEF